MVLNDGKIVEMKIGEGKILVVILVVVLNVLKGESVFVVIVNDYLVYRDFKEMELLYYFLGYSVGMIIVSVWDDDEWLEIYFKDIVYGINNEFGFDYLRDNMKYFLEYKV